MGTFYILLTDGTWAVKVKGDSKDFGLSTNKVALGVKGRKSRFGGNRELCSVWLLSV